jgi:hypothetical protein
MYFSVTLSKYLNETKACVKSEYNANNYLNMNFHEIKSQIKIMSIINVIY